MKEKYPSTPHLQWSAEKHRDDSYHPDPSSFVSHEVVLLEKMDGENLSIYPDGSWHARSVDTPYHPTREWAGRVAGEVGWQLPEGWRICAENLYGTHSIKYTNLRDYVQVFGIVNEKGEFLSWQDTVKWCELLELTPVPELFSGVFDYRNGEPLVRSYADEETLWLRDVTEEDINEMAGRTSEGYVMRISERFDTENFEHSVGKWVRPNHVQTDEHWLRKWEKEGEKNELV